MNENVDVEFWNGQLLELLVSEEVYITQIIEKERYLGIQMPKTKTGVPMTIDEGRSVTINFYDDVQGICTFDSRVVQLEDGLIIKKPSPGAVKRVQRRRFFRVKATTAMRLTLLAEDESEEDKTWDLYTHDISGGGFSFLQESKILEIDDVIHGIVELKREIEENEAQFTAKVVNIMKQPNDFYKVSLEFQEITESERSEIISYCMFKQIELRKKIGKE